MGLEQASEAARQARISRKLESWFALAQRKLPWRSSYDPYHVWVSEVMLQQTRMEVVIGYFERFIAGFPDTRSLARAEVEQVLALWSGLGYYRRARQLHQGARELVRLHAGRLPEDHSALVKIPGIGRYTAGAILSIGYNQPSPVVDGNVARVLARVEALEDPLQSPSLARKEWRLATGLVIGASSPRMLNQALMELGALICKPRDPECGVCPIRDDCRAHGLGAVERLPVPAQRKQVRSLRIPLYVIENEQGELLMRMERGSLMNGMYHLPHGNDALLPGGSIGSLDGEPLGIFRHTVTNRRIEFSLSRVSLAGNSVGDSADEWFWIDPGDLDRLPHPSYVKKAIRLLGMHR